MPTFLLSPLPETIPELEEQIGLLENEQKRCESAIRDFMAREDPLKDVAFPAEIHALRQQKIMLETHKEFRKVRIRRLRLVESGS